LKRERDKAQSPPGDKIQDICPALGKKLMANSVSAEVGFLWNVSIDLSWII